MLCPEYVLKVQEIRSSKSSGWTLFGKFEIILTGWLGVLPLSSRYFVKRRHKYCLTVENAVNRLE